MKHVPIFMYDSATSTTINLYTDLCEIMWMWGEGSLRIQTISWIPNEAKHYTHFDISQTWSIVDSNENAKQ